MFGENRMQGALSKFVKIGGDAMWKQKILPLSIPIVICLNNVITNSIF